MILSIVLGILVVAALIFAKFRENDTKIILARIHGNHAPTSTVAVGQGHGQSNWLKWLGDHKWWFIILGVFLFVVNSCDIRRNDFSPHKTLIKEVASMEPFELCGVEPGLRTFSIPKGRGVEVRIKNEKTGVEENTDITSALLINGTVLGERTEVKGKCATGSFAVNGDFQKNKFVRQIIAIAYQ